MDNRKRGEALKEVIKEADTPEVVPVVEETPVVETPVEEVPQEEITPQEEAPEPTPQQEPVKEEVKEEIDYKERYTQAGREALTQYLKNKKIADTIEEAQNMTEPTEDELRDYARKNGAVFDELDEFTRSILKDTFLNKRRFEKISEIQKSAKEIDAWVDKVDKFIESPEIVTAYPSLEGNEDEFRKFSLKAERRGMDLSDLVASFLYGLGSIAPKKSKGSMLLSGGGGVAPIAKPEKLNDEEAMAIRIKDPKEYKRLIKAGKIGIEI